MSKSKSEEALEKWQDGISSQDQDKSYSLDDVMFQEKMAWRAFGYAIVGAMTEKSFRNRLTQKGDSLIMLSDLIEWVEGRDE